MRNLMGDMMKGTGGVTRDKPVEAQTIMVGDVELKEVQRQRGHFTGYKEKGAETIVVDMRMAKRGYNLKVDFLGGGEWVRKLKGDELDKILEEWDLKGEERGKVLHEGDLRGAELDKVLKGRDMVRVVKGVEGGADLEVLKLGRTIQILRGAMVKNHVDINEGWEGIPHGTAGTSEEFPKFWDNASMAYFEYLKIKGRDLPDRITPFLGQAHTL